ncbi:MAG: beta-N-acetylhexosaminidase [Candidatus Latescibacterota bacterium]
MQVYILPVPRKIQSLKGAFPLREGLEILLCGNSSITDVSIARILAGAISGAPGSTLPKIARTAGGPEKGCINLLIEDGHAPEEYRLEISPESIVIGASTSRALLYGVRTLQQIREQSGKEISCLSIQDSPEFENRGFYHDISRGKVPRLETMKLLLEKASRYKLNQFQFYVEHVFGFRKNPAIGKNFEVITPDEVLALDEYARSLYIDLVPSLASFGHMYEILQNPAYAHLNEFRTFDPAKQMLWKNRMEFHTIDVSNEESYTLLGEMFDDYLPNFSSEWFNICCDETWYLGMDRNKDRAAREGKGNLYLGHVLRLCDMVKARGKKVMMWGDILVKFPDLLNRLPQDVVLLNWEYGSTVSDKQSALFGSKPNVWYNCPGVWGWSKFLNTFESGSANIRRMVDYGKRYGAKGILNTDWGDYGHVNPLAGSFPGFVLGAALSWNTACPDDLHFERMVSVLDLSDQTGKAAGLLRELGALHARWRVMMEGIDSTQAVKFPDDRIVATCRRGPEIEKELARLREKVPADRRIDYDEFLWSARAIALNGRLALLAKRKAQKKLGQANAAELRDFARDMRKLASDLALTWRARNKESELFRITEIMEGIAKEAEGIARG